MTYLTKIEKHLVILSASLLPISYAIYHFTAQYEKEPTLYLYAYVYYIAFLPGGLLALHIAFKQGLFSRIGKAFFSISLGLLAMVAGSLVWDYYAFYTPESPYPTIAEAFFILLVPCIAIGIMYIIGIYKISVKKWSWLLALVAIIGWYFYAIDLAEFSFASRYADGYSQLETITEYAYLVSDAITAGIVVFLLTIMGGRLVGTLRIFTLGFISFGVANVTFFYRSWNDLYFDGDISDTLYLLSGFIMSIGVVRFYHSLQSKKQQNIQNPTSH